MFPVTGSGSGRTGADVFISPISSFVEKNAYGSVCIKLPTSPRQMFSFMYVYVYMAVLYTGTESVGTNEKVSASVE